MATIPQEITIGRDRASGCDAVRDVGHIDARRVRAFVVACRLEKS